MFECEKWETGLEWFQDQRDEQRNVIKNYVAQRQKVLQAESNAERTEVELKIMQEAKARKDQVTSHPFISQFFLKCALEWRALIWTRINLFRKKSITLQVGNTGQLFSLPFVDVGAIDFGRLAGQKGGTKDWPAADECC